MEDLTHTDFIHVHLDPQVHSDSLKSPTMQKMESVELKH
jgi:hypothetical protein